MILLREVPVVERVLDGGADDAGAVPRRGLRVLARGVRAAAAHAALEELRRQRQRQLRPRAQPPLRQAALRLLVQAEGESATFIYIYKRTCAD